MTATWRRVRSENLVGAGALTTRRVGAGAPCVLGRGGRAVREGAARERVRRATGWVLCRLADAGLCRFPGARLVHFWPDMLYSRSYCLL